MKEQCLRFFQKPRGNSEKKQFGRYEKRIFCLEKGNLFERVRLKTAKRKKDETKRRRKTEGVSQGDEKKE